jgi:cell division septal protein FtsQ
MLALLAGIAALYGVASTEAFTVQRTEVTGNTWTPDQEIRAAMALPESQNAFALRTADLAGRLLRIPTRSGWRSPSARR